ncbi:MAG: eukaryotic-like serine/threonine-protein kinase [Phycisphaerales bacterium]|jgi:serine/threonine-protein kinase|nr:eukaryotic-like serine/threonine-protein kinase [Phycisphaerales bacterium]
MTLFGVGTNSTSSSSSSAQPKTLFGYNVIDLIGEGAGSLIYAVNDAASGQIYALKHVIRKDDKDIRFVEQLEAEHEVGQLIRHPGVRRTIDLKVNKSLLMKVTEAALIMELFDGRPLEFVKAPSMLMLVDIFINTARALDALHALGYVHCDLKPNNILVNDKFHVKVIDLGQAAKQGTKKTRIQGTPDYIAPEQVNCAPVTYRTDVFNLGATMYWSLTNTKLPTLYTVSKKENSFLLDAKIDTPASLNKSVPEPLSNLIMECVKTSPVKRPKNMNEVATRLETIRHVVAKAEAVAPPAVVA